MRQVVNVLEQVVQVGQAGVHAAAGGDVHVLIEGQVMIEYLTHTGKTNKGRLFLTCSASV